MHSISACPRGFLSRSLELPLWLKTLEPWTITAPTGTSPRRPARRAEFSANPIKKSCSFSKDIPAYKTVAREKVCLKPIYAKLCGQWHKNFGISLLCRPPLSVVALRSNLISFFWPLTELEKLGFEVSNLTFSGPTKICENTTRLRLSVLGLWSKSWFLSSLSACFHLSF